MSRATIAACLCVLLFSGCTRVTVHKDPTPHDKGIRYYRPKPYLFITPDSAPDAGKPTLTATTTIKQPLPFTFQQVTDSQDLYPGKSVAAAYASEDEREISVEDLPPGAAAFDARSKLSEITTPPKVSIQMMYMPDFAEEYSIQLKPGLGIGELNVKLDNGWNLTSVGMKTDQQTDEIIKSVSDLVSSVGGAVKSFRTDDRGTERMTVLATNIPFGFYEAVIATDPRGHKQLYGWRYVGFLPFQTCPTTVVGRQTVCCDDPNAIYGLVMDSTGVLRFERLAVIPDLPQMTAKD